MVTFYAIPGSQQTGEHPVLTSGQDITSYKVKQYTNVKYTSDLTQNIRVPAFSGAPDCSIVHLQGVGYFWINGYRTETITANSITFSIDFNAPMSMLNIGDTVTGEWLRLPTWTDYLRQNVADDRMEISNRSLLQLQSCGDFTDNSIKFYVYWVEIVSTNAYTDIQAGTKKTDSITKYGFFAAYAPEASEAYRLNYYLQYKTVNGYKYTYPSLNDVVNDVDSAIGIEASSIINISISRRCPYRWIGVDSERWLIDDTSTTRYANLVRDHPLYGGGKVGIYRIDKPMRITADGSSTSGYACPQTERTLTVSISSFQKAVGQLTLVDEAQNTIADLDTSLLEENALTPGTYNVEIKVRVRSDFTGIYTYVKFAGSLFAMNEGHLPWVGSAWETYRAYSLDSDRQAVANAKQIADEEQRIGLVNAGMNAIGTGGFTGSNIGQSAGLKASVAGAAAVGAVSFGLDWLQSEMSKQLTFRKLDMDQALTEKRMREASGTPFATAYGLIYCEYMIFGGAQIMLSMPKNIDESYYNDYTDHYGFPAQGVTSQTIQSGYWQGRLPETDNDMTGPKMERLNRTFLDGLRIVTVAPMRSIDIMNSTAVGDMVNTFNIDRGTIVKLVNGGWSATPSPGRFEGVACDRDTMKAISPNTYSAFKPSIAGESLSGLQLPPEAVNKVFTNIGAPSYSQSGMNVSLGTGITFTADTAGTYGFVCIPKSNDASIPGNASLIKLVIT